jgi:hypothetical protein
VITSAVAVLPDGWDRVEEAMLETALARTLLAFGDGGVSRAVGHLEKYYDPQGGYSGATFLGVGPNDPYEIGAADLWAVSTLSMKIPVRTGRALLQPGPLRDTVQVGLHRLSPTSVLADVSPSELKVMETVYTAVRSGVPSPTGADTTNQWVLAAKIFARKRPQLFPVRDSKVCTYLADGRMGGRAGQLGWFRRDIQVFAQLISDNDVLDRLAAVRRELAERRPEWSIDGCDLRLLDAVLWTEATMP